MDTPKLKFFSKPITLSDNSVVYDVFCTFGHNQADYIYPAESAEEADALVTALNEAATKVLHRTNS